MQCDSSGRFTCYWRCPSDVYRLTLRMYLSTLCLFRKQGRVRLGGHLVVVSYLAYVSYRTCYTLKVLAGIISGSYANDQSRIPNRIPKRTRSPKFRIACLHCKSDGPNCLLMTAEYINIPPNTCKSVHVYMNFLYMYLNHCIFRCRVRVRTTSTMFPVMKHSSISDLT